MQYFDLARPTDPAQAAMLAARPGAKYIGGGTDLMQLLKNDVERPTYLVELDFVLDDRIDTQGGSLRIGGRARMSDAALHPLVAQNFPVVAEALLASASPQVRNMASMAGNLLQRTRCGYFRDTGFPCNKRVPGSGCPAIEGENRMLAVLGTSEACIASNPSDLAVALAAMDAALDLRGPDGARQLAVTDFHLLPGEHPEHETVLRPGEMIEAIRIPLSPMGRRSTYVKVRDRQSFEFAVVSAAVGLDMDGGTVRDARVALGGVGTKPWRARAAEAALRGRQAGDAAWRDAAAAALQGAVPRSKNAFKIKLAQSTLVRALAALA